MTKIIQQYNRIFLAGAALLLTILMANVIPASAAETSTYTLYGQQWKGDGDQTVTYELVSQNTGTACTYYYDDGSENGTQTGTLSGDATGKIVFQWTTPGVYTFDLKAATADKTNYTYDRTVYRIYVYARNTEPFVTAQDLSKAGDADEGKVNEILFTHTYTTPRSDDGGSGGGDGGSGGGSSNSSASSNTTQTITESGSILDNIIRTITEWGDQSDVVTAIEEGGSINHQNRFTGDDSNMILYGFLSILAIITLTVWYIRHRRA